MIRTCDRAFAKSEKKTLAGRCGLDSGTELLLETLLTERGYKLKEEQAEFSQECR